MMANMSKVMDTTTTATTVMSSTGSSNQTNATAMPNAFQGICPSDCKLIWVVVPLLFIGMLMTFSTVSPTQTATLRCVAAKQKTLAIGVQWLVLRLLGTTPGPLILGSIIDSACRVWQEVCSETGSCWVYEKTDMGVKMFIWWCLTKSLSVLFYFCAQYFYKPPEKIVSDDDEDKPTIKPYDFVDTKESVI